MKRFLLFLVILALTSPVFGQESPQTIHESGKNQVIVSYGEITAPNDTFWIPGHTVLSYLDADSTNDPNVWGINLSQHRLLGVEVIIIQPDTTLNDSLLVDLWTGYYGHKDSLILAAAATQITDGTLFDTCITFPTCPKARHWYFLSDSTESPEYWWQRYAWLRLRTHMTEIFRTDTTFTGAPDGDVWAADGDSLYDWNTTNADGIFYKMFTTAVDYDSFAYVHGKDSLLAIAMNEMAIAESPGTIDSLTFAIAYCESIVVLAADTLGWE